MPVPEVYIMLIKRNDSRCRTALRDDALDTSDEAELFVPLGQPCRPR